ncbi:MAG: hypothetical protein LH660_07135 [Phormidesmis sp. CAN_BIN36]|nr:hypothetical protein [Phormidesmis sp. CAN_BIN36]
MINTFSSITIRVTIVAAGLGFAAIGTYTSSQSVSGFTQSFHSRPELGAQAAASHAWAQSLNWKVAPSTVGFNPEPNPEPTSTGGTGTR